MESRRIALNIAYLTVANFTIWIFLALLLSWLEGGAENAYKCGVKRVRRDFVDGLWWNASRRWNEEEWKSAARRKLIEFEDAIHEAVEAGIASYSGQQTWTLGNAFTFVFGLCTSIGGFSIAPTTTPGTLLCSVALISFCPLFFGLVDEIAELFILLCSEISLKMRRDETFLGGSIRGCLRESLLALSSQRELESEAKVEASAAAAVVYRRKGEENANRDCLLFPIAFYALIFWIVFGAFFVGLGLFLSPVKAIDLTVAAIGATSNYGLTQNINQPSPVFSALFAPYVIVGVSLFRVYSRSFKAKLFRQMWSFHKKKH